MRSQYLDILYDENGFETALVNFALELPSVFVNNVY